MTCHSMPKAFPANVSETPLIAVILEWHVGQSVTLVFVITRDILSWSYCGVGK